eukprot:7573852-Karenia_brevis.AAC.1
MPFHEWARWRIYVYVEILKAGVCEGSLVAMKSRHVMRDIQVFDRDGVPALVTAAVFDASTRIASSLSLPPPPS